MKYQRKYFVVSYYTYVCSYFLSNIRFKTAITNHQYSNIVVYRYVRMCLYRNLFHVYFLNFFRGCNLPLLLFLRLHFIEIELYQTDLSPRLLKQINSFIRYIHICIESKLIMGRRAKKAPVRVLIFDNGQEDKSTEFGWMDWQSN